jgi:hypothetical protein
LKVDVEGFEVEVLSSLEEQLAPSRFPNVVCEFGPEGLRAAGSSGSELVKLMLDHGYGCRDLHTAVVLHKPENIPALPDFHVTDLLFTAGGRS